MIFRRRISKATALALVLGSTMALAQTPAARPPRTQAARTRTPYPSFVRSWHAPTEGKTPPVDASGRPMLAFVSLNTGDRIELAAATDRGAFSASDLDHAAHVLRDSSTGNEHPMEPRMVDLAYRIQTHFAAEEIRVISGYRTPRRGNGSNHGKGRAIDMVVPGAKDDEVAKFARELGFVGVGVYTTSGFVHVDVRDRSYFWVDGSGPGKRNRARGILGELASRGDRQALERGERPLPPQLVGLDVDAALRARARVSEGQGASEDEDDDTDPSE
jgi:uncharacterized protein YcbK (DUF882 family)